MRFFTPQILFDGPPDIGGESYINLGSNWAVLITGDKRNAKEIKERELAQEELEIHSLRGAKVTDVSIESPEPHLRVRFEDGRELLMCGHDENYEPWQAGLNHSNVK